MNNKYLCDNLNMLMARSRVSSSELARLTGLPATTIKRIRNHEQANPTVATILPLAKHFSVSINDLIGCKIDEDAAGGYSVREGVAQLPLLSWAECALPEDKRSSQKKIPTEREVSNRAFALIVEDRDLEFFPVNSVLVVESELTPMNGDYVIVAKSHGVATLRKYITEMDQVYLKSLVAGVGIQPLTVDYQVVGVVVQYRVELRA